MLAGFIYLECFFRKVNFNKCHLQVILSLVVFGLEDLFLSCLIGKIFMLQLMCLLDNRNVLFSLKCLIPVSRQTVRQEQYHTS